MNAQKKFLFLWERPFNSHNPTHKDLILTKYVEHIWPKEPQRGGGKFLGVLEHNLVLSWNYTSTPEQISSYSTQETNKIPSTHLVSPHLIFYFWLSGLMMMEILQSPIFYKETIKKFHLLRRQC